MSEVFIVFVFLIDLTSDFWTPIVLRQIISDYYAIEFLK